MAENKVPFQNLGRDIIIDELFKFLDYNDIISLSITCKDIYQLTLNDSVWHDLYIRSFGINESIPDSSNWRELFYWRMNAKWFSWGKTTTHRLRIQNDKIDNSIVTGINPRTLGICRPIENGPLLVDEESFPKVNRSNPIKRLYSGGTLEGILQFNNQLFAQGTPAPISRRHVPIMPFRGRNVVHRMNIQLPHVTVSEEDDDVSHEQVNAGENEIKILQASFGRYHILATNSENNLVVGLLQFGTGVNYYNVILPDELKGKKIIKLCAGWGTSNLILIEDIGLVLYEHDERKPFKVQNYHIICPTEDSVVDFFLGEDFIIYLDSHKNLYSVNLKIIPTVNKFRLSNIQEKFKELYLAKTSRIVSDLPSIIRVNGWFRRFAIYDDYGNVIIAEKNDIESSTNELNHNQFDLRVYQALQNNNCSSIAFGDHHTMALIEGKIYVWGSESQSCGCFGLGIEEEILKLPTSSKNRGGLQLQEPTVIPIDGYVVAIGAGGWQSSALIVDTPLPTKI